MVNSIGVAAMAGIVLAAPEVGLVATMGTAATTVAYGELFNYLIENGSDKFVEYCALQGRTEAESVRYGTAAAGIVGKLLKVAVIRGGLKSIGGKKKRYRTNHKHRRSLCQSERAVPRQSC